MLTRARRWGSAAACAVLATIPAVAAGHPGHNITWSAEDGPALIEHDQHGGEGGHLPPSVKDVELVGKVKLTNVANGIADVSAFGHYAYLNAFSPECAGREGAQGTGVHIVDIKDPAHPVKVGFLPAHPNSYVGEGIHIFHAETPFFSGDLLVHNNESCDTTQETPGGVSIWNVTDPLHPVQLVANFGDASPPIDLQTFHTTHSVQGFTLPGHAYVVLQDNNETRDIDIVDVTNPASPVLISETGLADFPEATQHSSANGDNSFHHDMQFKVIDKIPTLAISYWDAGQVLLDVSDPAHPKYMADSDFANNDPEMIDAGTGLGWNRPEGNSHNSFFSSDGKWLLATDEDFSPFRTRMKIETGPSAGEVGGGEFGWTVPLTTSHPEGVSGPTVWGGRGCAGDPIPPASNYTWAAGDEKIVVLSRGTCFFSNKVENGQNAGYDVVVVANHHTGSQNGVAPDAFICGSQGHPFTPTVVGLCTSHKTLHVLFGDAPEYSAAEPPFGGDLPPVGTMGQRLFAEAAFDGWGYVHLYEVPDLKKADGSRRLIKDVDTFAIPEAADRDHAFGFGNMTVHEVKTDPRKNGGKDLAYLSYYDAGLRVVKFGPKGIVETGHYIAEGGSDFWGTFPLCTGECLKHDTDKETKPEKGEKDKDSKRPLLLMSDRDSGLWIFRYTGKE